jgi:hypothetical protein
LWRCRDCFEAFSIRGVMLLFDDNNSSDRGGIIYTNDEEKKAAVDAPPPSAGTYSAFALQLSRPEVCVFCARQRIVSVITSP